jgi:two-component system sensor histidine kinase TctE
VIQLVRPFQSLRGRLLITLLLPLLALSLIFGGLGVWTIRRIVESSNDRLLSGSLLSITETLGIEGGQFTLDLPAAALGMLENPNGDSVYYRVTYDGRQITGYPSLPAPDLRDARLGSVTFRYASVNGAPVRVATAARIVPGLGSPVIVQVAETLKSRDALQGRLLIMFAVASLALLSVVALLVWLAVGWGLRPLQTLRQEVSQRGRVARFDFRPLPRAGVPTELQSLVDEFNSLFVALEKAATTLERFTSDASHQIRTPLTIVRANLDRLLRDNLDAAAGKAVLADMNDAVRKLQRLVLQLISMARAESPGNLADTANHFDLAQSAQRVIQEYMGAARDAELSLEYRAAQTEAIDTRGEPFVADEIIGNLLDNAIRYSHSGGCISISLRSRPAPAIDIEDNGPGIPPAERDKVFERFYRLKNTRAQPGSGLGLPIVRALADRLGATVTLNTAAGCRGLKVTVEFLPPSLSGSQ